MKAQRMVQQSLIAADQRRHTCLRDANNACDGLCDTVYGGREILGPEPVIVALSHVS